MTRRRSDPFDPSDLQRTMRSLTRPAYLDFDASRFLTRTALDVTAFTFDTSSLATVTAGLVEPSFSKSVLTSLDGFLALHRVDPVKVNALIASVSKPAFQTQLPRFDAAAVTALQRQVAAMYDLSAVVERIGNVRFENFIKSPLIPLDGLHALIDGLRVSVGDLLDADDLMEELDEAAAEVESVADQSVWWVYKLPFPVQWGIYVATLQLLDSLQGLFADVADLEVPAEVESATEVMFALAGLLLLVIAAQTKPQDEK